MDRRNEYIAQYWKKGWKYKDIQAALLIRHGINLSKRHLQRLITSLGLRRKLHTTDIDEVINFVIDQINTIGQMHGYRMMALKCAQAGLYVTRETVREIIKIVDPEGVDLRRRKRLIRRRYYGRGPNNNWHIGVYRFITVVCHLELVSSQSIYIYIEDIKSLHSLQCLQR